MSTEFSVPTTSSRHSDVAMLIFITDHRTIKAITVPMIYGFSPADGGTCELRRRTLVKLFSWIIYRPRRAARGSFLIRFWRTLFNLAILIKAVNKTKNNTRACHTPPHALRHLNTRGVVRRDMHNYRGERYQMTKRKRDH